jgi:hypothetical protein
MGYGNGFPHERTGAGRDPVTGGTGGSAAPLETAPAPSISFVTTIAVPNGSWAAGLPTRRPPKTAAIPRPAIPPTAAINISRRLQADEPPLRGFLITKSWASGAGTATIRESEATPTALPGSFSISLRPGLADGALFSRRHGTSLERADDEQHIQEDEEHTLQ